MNNTLVVFALLAAPVAAQEAPARDTAAANPAALQDCLRKCADGVRPPRFAHFPQLQFVDANVGGGVGARRMRSYLTFQVVVGADGVIEPESVQLTGGTARSAETEVRQALAQARFTPGQLTGVPVRTRVTLRFDFEAEGVGSIKYTYRVVAR